MIEPVSPEILAAAKELHAAEFLKWVRWEQLFPETQAEFVERATKRKDT